MKISSFIIVLFTGINSFAQVSVFGYQYYNQSVTQQLIDAAGPVFHQQSVLFPNTTPFLFIGASDKEIRATHSIKIEPDGDFKAGQHTGSGQTKLVIAKSAFDVAVMNYNALDLILKYEKFELGVELPQDIAEKVSNFVTESTTGTKLNPFLDWELKVVADFKHLSSGVTKSVDGFYFRNMKHNVPGNTWYDAGTNHPFRIRFAPPQTGKWECKVRILVNGVEHSQSETFVFQVVSSNNPGFVSVHANKKQFVRNGEVIFPVGTNLPFPGGLKATAELTYYNNVSGNYLNNYPLYVWTDYLDRIKAFGDQGGKYIRIFNSPSHAEVEYEKLGNYYDRLKFANEMDSLIELCHKKGIMIDFNLMLHTPIMKAGDYSQFDTDYGVLRPQPPCQAEPCPIVIEEPNRAYCYSSHFSRTEPNGLPSEGFSETPSENPSDMIMNDNAFKYIKQRYRYYISRYGYSTDIYMFELLSEPWHMNENGITSDKPYETNTGNEGAIVHAAVEKFHTQLSSYIKHDLQHDQHLIGAAGMLSTSIYSDPGENSIRDNSWSAPDIDVMTNSHYGAYPNQLIISKDYSQGNNNIFNDENSTASYIFMKVQAYNKPFYFSEAGWGDGTTECSFYKGHKTVAMQMAYLGLAGFNMWEGWTYPDKYSFDNSMYMPDMSWLWQFVIMAERHVNTDLHKLVYGSTWVQGRQKVKDSKREHQYLISENKELCVGYVFNRTYNAYTLNNNPSDPSTGCSKAHNGIAGSDIEFDDVYCTAEDQVFCSLALSGCKLRVEGLKAHTDYKVTWYNFSDGSEWYVDCINTGLGSTNYVLEHPTLFINGSPLIWYKIEQNNCNNHRPASNETKNQVENEDNISNDITGVSLFPNPTHDNIQITSGGFKIESYTITDILGQTSTYRVNETNTLTVDLSGFVAGMYTLKLNNRNEIYKIVKL